MISALKELYRHRELLSLLTGRELAARYKQTAARGLWAVFKPMSQLAVFVVVFGSLLEIPHVHMPYPIFVLIGLMAWNWFSTSVSRGAEQLLAQGSLLCKSAFPREIFPLTQVLVALADFGMNLVLLVALCLIHGVGPYWTWLLAIPVSLGVLLFISGLVLLFSALNMLFRDVGHGLGLLLQIGMYLSPVFYPAAVIPEKWRVLYFLNPMAGYIESLRACIGLGQIPPPLPLGMAIAGTAAALAGGYFVFKRIEPVFPDVL
ncbi:MAG: Teichoic acid translocation permease protein TagG [Myxococcota bacterium]|nr:Teichoic acid translocation permease protein TagG [Myxococcota bacterium]